jgi:hypothetical protein
MKKAQGKKFRRSGARLLRHWVKRMFRGWIKRQGCDCQEDVETLFARLKEMERSIDIMARQIVRRKKGFNGVLN